MYLYIAAAAGWLAAMLLLPLCCCWLLRCCSADVAGLRCCSAIDTCVDYGAKKVTLDPVKITRANKLVVPVHAWLAMDKTGLLFSQCDKEVEVGRAINIQGKERSNAHSS